MTVDSGTDINKNDLTHVETLSNETDFEKGVDIDTFPDVDPRRVMLKLDFCIIPVVSVLYLLSFLDRGNIGNANIEGLGEDLNLQGNQYNICLTMFFIPYAVFEVPSNMILKRMRPSIWLPTIMIAWGTVMTLMGIVHNFQGLLATRIFLGVTEAGLLPGVAFYLTMFYRREELQLRQSLFCSAASVAGAFSGILSWAIAKMDGVGNRPGWAWIFLLEGMVTVVIAVVSIFLLCDSPDNAKLLTPREREYLIHKLRDQTSPESQVDGHETRQSKIRHLKLALLDAQVWLQALMYLGVTTPIYGISLFLPTIVKSMGYTSSKAQLMTVPIYVVAAVISISLAYISDHYRMRSPIVVSCLVLQVVGFAIALSTDVREKPNVLYGAMILACAGAYAILPAAISWHASNLGHGVTQKKAIAMALQIGIGNFGGCISSNIYRSQDSPLYKLGHGLEMMFALIAIIAALFLVCLYTWRNRRKVKDLQAGKYANYTPEDFSQLVDADPHFTYML